MFPATLYQKATQRHAAQFVKKATAFQPQTQIVILADGALDVVCDTANEAARHAKELKRQGFNVQTYTLDRIAVDMFCDLVENGMGARKAYKAATQEVGQ